MKRRISSLMTAAVLFIFAATACNLPISGLGKGAAAPNVQGEPLTKFTPTVLVTPTPAFQGVWIQPSLPIGILNAIGNIQVQDAADADSASLVLKDTANAEGSGTLIAQSTWIYALAAPFFTVRDGVTLEQLEQIWRGNSPTDLTGIQLAMEESTRATFAARWGDASSANVVTKPAGELAPAESVWVIIPFEEIKPAEKVLKIDGLSPLDKPLAVENYPLKATFGLFQAAETDAATLAIAEQLKVQLPLTNRDESRMTVLIMSGTTAMTRATAFKIDTKGIDYVISGMKDWFLAADLRHVSNEVSFSADCPKPDPNTSSMRFCSNPAYIDVLKGLGINIVELTGNHENDYGPENFAQSVQTYLDLGWTIFGGGLTPEDARKPALVESNGNKIAFIGCNPVGPTNAWVTDSHAGVARCDPDYYYGQIRQLKQQGYVVIATFQHQEIYKYMYDDFYKTDFRKAAESGADIVSGAQAHFPMGFELSGNSLIHYGMGNFLFDQMDYPVVGTKREFVDRHIIYDGRYINTELLTAMLTDYSRPRPMTDEERTQFLTDLFTASQK